MAANFYQRTTDQAEAYRIAEKWSYEAPKTPIVVASRTVRQGPVNVWTFYVYENEAPRSFHHHRTYLGGQMQEPA